ncbi:cobalt transporter [Clostridia bacterium]|nr:cobalt transporter [Clostridia bacterium]
MKSVRAFETYHPLTLFAFFACALVICMFTLHPVLLAVCYLSGVGFYGMLAGRRKLAASLARSIPLTVLIAAVNPLFVHRGETPLFFLNDNAVTLEAILYGAAAAVMLMSVFYWFKCYNEVMTSDKFIYLFGRVLPKLSLILSMALRFVSRFKRQYREIDDAQRAMGMYASKSLTDRLRSAFRVFSALITWSLENSIETADSMRARGYGLRGRTSYNNFFWRRRDGFMLAFIVLTAGAVIALLSAGRAGFGYYPTVTPIGFSVYDLLCYGALTVLLFMTVLLEMKEAVRWRYSLSKI